MLPDPANYVGREQAYVKHYFLASYLERLIYKISSVFTEVVYVDGFSGPWQTKNERFEDTSFGIALAALTEVKGTFATMANPSQHRKVKMTAHLVEKDPAAFARLGELQHMFPDVDVVPHHGDFTAIAPQIAQRLPPQAFSFVLIDPKGWTVDLEAVRPLIGRKNCEVVFNFMFDFINRFALLDDPMIVGQLDRLIPGRDWRAPIRTLEQRTDTDANGSSVTDARKNAVIYEFKAALSHVGDYRFVADVDVMRPTKDRTLYFLVYGTRQAPGLEVFRDCHVKSLAKQSEIRGAAKMQILQQRSGQFELLASTNDMGPDRTSISLPLEQQRARNLLLELAPQDGSTIRWDKVWPVVLSQCVIRLTELKRIANECRKSGELMFPGWPSLAKRTPEDEYQLHRGDVSAMVQGGFI